jgi:hypothetical protein
MTTELQPTVDASTVERVLLHGDLQKLTPAQKISYYRAVCDSVGLNPLTQPFQYLVLNGKEILYARREATEQLRRLHEVSIAITARELLEGEVYVVTARATLPSGRSDENIGACNVAGLKGEARANQMMKAETKAKRRVTLAICGLGMLDETEVETIPEAKPQLAGYATLPAPPPEVAPLPVVPEGFCLIERIDSTPTKNPKVLKFFVTLSTGERPSTINSLLASLAEACCRDRTPVKVTIESTRWGPELKGIEREHEWRDPEQPQLTDSDIPF